MFEKESKTDIGSIHIKDEVISSIALIAAREVDGVVTTSGRFFDPLIHLFFRQWPANGIKVDILETEVKVTVNVILRYGIDIPKVSNMIQENIKNSIERMTGITLLDVDINVQKVIRQTDKNRQHPKNQKQTLDTKDHVAEESKT